MHAHGVTAQLICPFVVVRLSHVRYCELARSLMVGRSSETLSIKVQILVFVLFLGFSQDLPVLSGKWCSPDLSGAQSFGGAHIDKICVLVFIGVSMCVLWVSWHWSIRRLGQPGLLMRQGPNQFSPFVMLVRALGLGDFVNCKFRRYFIRRSSGKLPTSV